MTAGGGVVDGGGDGVMMSGGGEAIPAGNDGENELLHIHDAQDAEHAIMVP